MHGPARNTSGQEHSFVSPKQSTNLGSTFDVLDLCDMIALDSFAHLTNKSTAAQCAKKLYG